ncbi:TPA: hypothetical protein I7730_00050 [Vibrio vulnificus]|uniref:Uncharacterized protein n=1 Tax=Vibrio vulnificus TaxID=672 RepID=A0A8H9K4Y3_VIBVL|nr:hypothetical protein [Vibrio vulnificus]HAS8538189.1 hypothetical protein [Vibrio vulnificus]
MGQVIEPFTSSSMISDIEATQKLARKINKFQKNLHKNLKLFRDVYASQIKHKYNFRIGSTNPPKVERIFSNEIGVIVSILDNNNLPQDLQALRSFKGEIAKFLQLLDESKTSNKIKQAMLTEAAHQRRLTGHGTKSFNGHFNSSIGKRIGGSPLSKTIELKCTHCGGETPTELDSSLNVTNATCLKCNYHFEYFLSLNLGSEHSTKILQFLIGTDTINSNWYPQNIGLPSPSEAISLAESLLKTRVEFINGVITNHRISKAGDLIDNTNPGISEVKIGDIPLGEILPHKNISQYLKDSEIVKIYELIFSFLTEYKKKQNSFTESESGFYTKYYKIEPTIMPFTDLNHILNCAPYRFLDNWLVQHGVISEVLLTEDEIEQLGSIDREIRRFGQHINPCYPMIKQEFKPETRNMNFVNKQKLGTTKRITYSTKAKLDSICFSLDVNDIKAISEKALLTKRTTQVHILYSGSHHTDFITTLKELRLHGIDSLMLNTIHYNAFKEDGIQEALTPHMIFPQDILVICQGLNFVCSRPGQALTSPQTQTAISNLMNAGTTVVSYKLPDSLKFDVEIEVNYLEDSYLSIAHRVVSLIESSDLEFSNYVEVSRVGMRNS